MCPRAYFVRREPPRPVDFETYWKDEITDPDGTPRFPALERDRKVEDLRDELAFVNSMTPGRILDVGCGFGHLLSAVDTRWERHGVELSGRAAQLARQYGLIHHGDLRSAAYPAGYFDVVTMYHVIEHMIDPVSEVREIRRVLRPGGWLLVSTPNFDSACARRFGQNFRMLHDETHISLFGSSSLLVMLEDLGFLVEREEYPFFETGHFTAENLTRLFDISRVSPPFYGSVMTLYAKVPQRSRSVDNLGCAGRAAWRLAADFAPEIDHAREIITASARRGGTVFVSGPTAERVVALFEASARPAIVLRSQELPNDVGEQDVLLLVGASPQTMEIPAWARSRRLAMIALTDQDGPSLDCDVRINVPATEPAVFALVQDLVIVAIISN
jgi:SAM-dependent methyltransferase